MKPFCTIIVPIILPGVRALIAKEMFEKYKLTQKEISKKLGISQAAVSQYTRNIRGANVKLLENNKNVSQRIKQLAEKIVSKDLTAFELSKEFCDICKCVRKNKIICSLHHKEYSQLKECDICF